MDGEPGGLQPGNFFQIANSFGKIPRLQQGPAKLVTSFYMVWVIHKNGKKQISSLTLFG